MKYFSINVTRYVHNLYRKNCKADVRNQRTKWTERHTTFMNWKIQYSEHQSFKYIYRFNPAPIKIPVGFFW